jgi:phage baseplate assembly protein W
MQQYRKIVGSGWRFPLAVSARGGIALVGDSDEIEQAIILILSTPKGQRMMRPEFGCQIHDLRFAPINSSTLASAEHYVREALAWWEPRIDVVEVRAAAHRAQQACLELTITYQIKATHDERSLVFPFYTIPGEP